MKYQDPELQRFLKAFSPYSEEDLINEKLKHPSESAPFRAAEILLNKKNTKGTEDRHRESIQESRQANTLSRWAIFIAILSLIIAIIALFDKKQIVSKEKPSIESQMPASSSASPSSSKLPIPPVKAQKDKQQK